MKNPKPSVGLVLALTPRYSETFLQSKIRGLRDSGVEVRLFVGAGDRESGTFRALSLDRSRRLKSAFLSLWAWASLLAWRPQRLVRFVLRERELKRGWIAIMRGLAINHHMLLHARPGWLHFTFATLAAGAESVASAVGAKMGVSLRGYDITSYPIKNPGCYRHVWHRADKVHTISDDLVILARACGMPDSVPVLKITPAIDTGFFGGRSSNEQGNNSEWKLLTVARLHWKKGIEYVLMALKILSTRRPELAWNYTVAGDGGALERLAFAASEMGLDGRIHFAGKMTAEEIRKAYAESDIYLQYSVQEGFCNAVLEAQAMELPCIVSDAEGLPENVGSHGFVVPKRRPELLAVALEKTLAIPVRERRRIGKTARARVISEFNLPRQSEAFRQFFEVQEGHTPISAK